MLNYTFHYIQNTGMNHISSLQKSPSRVCLRSISGVVCVPAGGNLLHCSVQCVLMKQKKEPHAVSHTHLPKQNKSLLASKCTPVCTH